MADRRTEDDKRRDAEETAALRAAGRVFISNAERMAKRLVEQSDDPEADVRDMVRVFSMLSRFSQSNERIRADLGLTGPGEGAFAAGAQLGFLAGLNAAQIARFRELPVAERADAMLALKSGRVPEVLTLTREAEVA